MSFGFLSVKSFVNFFLSPLNHTLLDSLGIHLQEQCLLYRECGTIYGINGLISLWYDSHIFLWGRDNTEVIQDFNLQVIISAGVQSKAHVETSELYWPISFWSCVHWFVNRREYTRAKLSNIPYFDWYIFSMGWHFCIFCSVNQVQCETVIILAFVCLGGTFCSVLLNLND